MAMPITKKKMNTKKSTDYQSRPWLWFLVLVLISHVWLSFNGISLLPVGLLVVYMLSLTNWSFMRRVLSYTTETTICIVLGALL